jgi:hypothetical protein
MNSGIIYGLVSGLLAMSFVVAIYLNQPLNLISGLEKLSWLLIFSGMLVGVWRERSLRNEPFIGFQEALKTAYQIFILAYLIKFATVFVIFNYVEPSLNDSAREIAVKIFIEHKTLKLLRNYLNNSWRHTKKAILVQEFLTLA